MFKLRHHAYCGMSTLWYSDSDIRVVQDQAASDLRTLRSEGFPVAILEPRVRWEIQEPDDCYALIPDECGTLAITEEYAYRCQECGGGYDDAEQAWTCCQSAQEAR